MIAGLSCFSVVSIFSFADAGLFFHGSNFLINETTVLQFNCSSQAPALPYVEFLINDKTIASVTYDERTTECTLTHLQNDCANLCRCTSNGILFIWTFPKQSVTGTVLYSCSMFTVQTNLHEVAYLEYNGTDFISSISADHPFTTTIQTTTTKDVPESEKGLSKDRTVLYIFLGISTAILFVMVIVVTSIYLTKVRQIYIERKRWASLKKNEDAILLERKHAAPKVMGKKKTESNNSIVYRNVSGSGDVEKEPLIKERIQCDDTYIMENGGSCRLCKSPTARYKCLPCDEIVCNKCEAIHASSIATKSHPVLLICDVPEGLSLARYCKVHCKEETMFCTDHYEILCEECRLDYHTFCKVNVIDALYQIQTLKKFESLLHDQLKTFETMTPVVTARIALLDYNRDCISKMIEKFHMESIIENNLEMVENKTADLRKELKSNYDKLFGLYKALIDEIQQRCSQLKKLQSNLVFIKRLESRREEFLFVYCIRSKNNCDTITTTIKEFATILKGIPLESSPTLLRSSLGRSQIKGDNYYEKRNPKTWVVHDPRRFYANQIFRSLKNTEKLMPMRFND